MTTVFPTNNLPTASQPWAREVQKQLVNLIASDNSERINNTARDNQLNSSIIALGGVVTQVTNALEEIGLLNTDVGNLESTVLVAGEPTKINGANIKVGTLSASQITTGTLNANLVTVSNINASNITSGTINASTIAVTNINASNITSGTITGITLQTGSSGRRVVISGTSSSYYNSSNQYIGEITADGTSIFMRSTYGGYISVFPGGAYLFGDNNNQILLANGEIDFGTSRLVGTVPFDWQLIEGAQFGRGAIVASNTDANALSLARRASNGSLAIFYRSTPGGAIYTAGSISATALEAVAYNTTSDYRAKENVSKISNAIDKIKLIKPSRFNFKSEPGKFLDGFIAHELQEVLPEAVTGEKDAVDEDGKPVYQGVDQSKLVPLAIAAIQELTDRIETLEKGA